MNDLLEKKTKLASILYIITTLIIYIFGKFDTALKIFIVMLTLDVITGLAVAIHKKKVNSQKFFQGFMKKFLMFIVIAVANMIDIFISETGVKTNGLFRDFTLSIFIANEGLSILENAGKYGVPLPRKLYEFLEQLHNHKDDSTKDISKIKKKENELNERK